MTPPKIKWYYNIRGYQIVKCQTPKPDSFALYGDAQHALATILAEHIKELEQARRNVWNKTVHQLNEIV